jgi:diacylglycerol kinase (ATP)
MTQTPQKAIVIHSPHSGRSGHLTESLARLQALGISVLQSISVADLDMLPPQGATWREQGAEVAIAAGGDGLVGGVITHIAGSGLPLGILPLGTANDIARTLLIPSQIGLAARVIANGAIEEIDIGVAKPAEQAPHLASKGQHTGVLSRVPPQKHGYFAHALTVGMNVQFARIATNVATRQRFGRLTYPLAAIETLKYLDRLNVVLRFEELNLPPGLAQAGAPVPEELLSLSCRALQITIINAPIFGGQWNLRVPFASIQDRLLDIVVIEEVELSHLNALMTQFFAAHGQTALDTHNDSQHHGHHPAELSGIPGIHHFQAKGVLVTTNRDPHDVTLDGEVRGQTPMYVHMADERLPVIVPSS